MSQTALRPARALAFTGAAAALGTFVVLQAVAWQIAGLFEYPLDDVYIHLAMAAHIAQGHYGVNASEAASAASSILYPLLLVPFSASEVQRWLPLLWNALSVAAVGALWGMALARSGLSAGQRLGFALAGPVALNVAGVGFTGMENSLHAAAALATIIGLRDFLRGPQRVTALLAVGVIAAPLLRLEGLALSGLACLVLLAHRRVGAGVALGLAALLPVVAFSAFLTQLGIGPLPASVMTKIDIVAQGAGPLMRLVVGVVRNLSKVQGQLVAGLVVLCAVLPLSSGVLRREGRGWILLIAAAAGLAHLLAGQIGWMHRYEHYVIMVLMAALVMASDGVSEPRQRKNSALLLAAVLGVSAVVFWPGMASRYIWNPRAISLQQVQMARFAQDYVRAPVVVNDLGRVVWRNPEYVLDLYGLGSPEVLRRHLLGTSGPWAGELAAAHGARLAMIYEDWFGPNRGPDWVRLGELSNPDFRGALGDDKVTFYATAPQHVAPLRAALAAFVPTLPAGTIFTPAGE